jgi:hypothetical protein
MPDDWEQRFRAMERENSEMRNDISLLRVEMVHLSKGLDSLNAVLSKIAWIFAGGFIAAFVAFVVGGGLAH